MPVGHRIGRTRTQSRSAQGRVRSKKTPCQGSGGLGGSCCNRGALSWGRVWCGFGLPPGLPSGRSCPAPDSGPGAQRCAARSRCGGPGGRRGIASHPAGCLTACGKTHAAFDRRCIPAEPRRFPDGPPATSLRSPRGSRRHRCVSVEIRPGQFSRWPAVPHAPRQPGDRENWRHRENWASPVSALTGFHHRLLRKSGGDRSWPRAGRARQSRRCSWSRYGG